MREGAPDLISSAPFRYGFSRACACNHRGHSRQHPAHTRCRALAPVSGADEAARRGADRDDCHRGFVAGHARFAATAATAARQPGHRPRRCQRGHAEPDPGPAHRCAHGAHPHATAAHRRTHRTRGPVVCSRAWRGIHAGAVPAGQRADRPADLCIADRLCRHLHTLAQARHTAEHRDWRRRRCCTAGAGLGRHHQHHRSQCTAAVPDHLRLDTAAFLGAGHCTARRLRQGGHSHASRDAWRGGSRGCMCCCTPSSCSS